MMASQTDFENVVNHLMFQKSIIDDDEDLQTKIGRYVRIAQELQSGTLVPSDDPFERCVAQVFELVVQQQFNPWDINLIEFSKTYMAKVRKATDVNLIIAGKIVYMAWEILRLQSDFAVSKADRPETCELAFEGLDPTGFDLFSEPFDLCGGEALLYTEEMPIDERIRRKSERPVTLIDLLDAFEEAKKESDIKKELARFMKKYRRPDFDDKTHKESLEDDIADVWERVQRFGNGPIPASDLYLSGREDHITVLVSMLFLAKMGKVHIWQEKPPFGEIFLEVKVPWDIAQLEDAAVVENVQTEKVAVVK
jgi:segregation and condensation protein A